MKKLYSLLTLAICLAGISANAQDLKPQIQVVAPGSGVIISRVSDNGLWGVSETGSQTEGSIAPSGGVLFNLTTMAQTDISDKSGLSGVSDVTDDGSVVVGECQGVPAYWSAATGEWTKLKMPPMQGGGRLNAVTPDGHYAVGYTTGLDDIYAATPVMYDLTTNTRITLTGLPTLDMTHEDKKQNCFYDISPDGRYIVGELSQSYLMPCAICCYVYDRQEGTYKMIGFNPSDTQAWTPEVQYLHFIDRPCMSPNGEWVVGYAYIVQPQTGTDWPREHYTAFRYNVASQQTEVYNGANDSDMGALAVFNDGTVLAATPAENPWANAYVRSGDYYIGLDQILAQNYGMDYYATSGFENTGRAVTSSGDGSLIVFLTSPYDCYILRLKEPIGEAAARVNLLANYTVNPKEGALLSQLKTFTFNFDRDIAQGSTAKITFSDGTNTYNPVSSNGINYDGKKLTLTFRTRELVKDTEYTLTIPEGRICIKGDKTKTSPLISLKYTGRANTPVAMTESYPADDATVSHLDLTTNPLIITFDADLTLVEGSTAQLFRQGESDPFCTLNLAVADRRMLVYPVARQNFFQGTDYTVKIPAGVVTDLSGGCPNEEFTLTFHGSYVREISSDDKYIFFSDCNDYDSFMFYEGDRLQPSTTPFDWGFTSDASPWLIVRSSDEVVDMAMASHSMYQPAGTSDDWMVTAQLFIPDADCYLNFDAQSYLNGKQDRLKVYVYHNRSVYNTLTSDIIADIRANGELVFDQVLSPGQSEEGLEDDWTNYTVRLPQYAGKEIYVAFVNENTDQSAIFLDNIAVVHDLSYLTTFEHSSRVVAQDSHKIKGNITIVSELDTYKDMLLVLKDGNATEIDRIEEKDINLAKGDLYRFEFDNHLPLQAGSVNPYTLEVTLDGRTSIISGEIKNLAFEPYKRVVLEEYAGSDCSNCPQGIVAIENIEKLYPGQLIPITLRTYQGDPLGTGMGSYSQFLGMENVGAPSARLNRGPIYFPMINENGDYRFSGAGIPNEITGKDEICWLDAFRTEIAQPAEAEVNFASAYDPATRTASVSAKVRNALNATGANINVFAVIVENGLETYQANGFSQFDDPDFGQWGKGGIYGSTYAYPVIANDVARATYGTTFNGTGGLVPSTIESGKEYPVQFSMPLPQTVANPDNCHMVVMLVDAAKGNVLNANIAKLDGGDTTGIADAVADSSTIAITLIGSRVLAPEAAALHVYDLTGRLIAAGTTAADLGAFQGVAIAKASASDGSTTTAKLTVK